MMNQIDDPLRNESTMAGQHAVLMAIAAAGSYLMTLLAIGPVKWSTSSRAGRKLMIA
jgi:hypothetical protein